MYDNIQFSNWTQQSCVTYKIHTFRSFCLRNLDSAMQLLMGFRLPWPVFQISNPRIHDSTSNNCPNSSFHKQTFPWLWNQDLLTSEATQPWKQIWYKNTYVSLNAGYQSMHLFWFCSFFFFPFVYLLCYFLVLLQFPLL